jgi:guanylate kinase
LIVLVGDSGSGKTELSKALMGPPLHLHRVISCTTRPRREGEVDGIHYRFLEEAEFKRRLSAGHFVEYDQPFGEHLYGRLHSDLSEVGFRHCICDMTEPGVAALQEYPERYDKLVVIRVEARNSRRVDRAEARAAGDEARKRIPIRVDEVVINDHGDPDGLRMAVDRLLVICNQYIHPEG